MAAANCLVIVEEETTTIEAGSRVTVVPLLLSNR
jgi:molybdopterin biosynthesis enzyme